MAAMFIKWGAIGAGAGYVLAGKKGAVYGSLLGVASPFILAHMIFGGKEWTR
jgi:outer membrane lipoprotein SlyB